MKAWFAQHGLPEPELEYKAIPDRKFRWDWRIGSVLVEIQGGLFSAGAHSRALGIMRDMEKNNLAVAAGYRCLYFTPQNCFTPEAAKMIRHIILTTLLYV